MKGWTNMDAAVRPTHSIWENFQVFFKDTLLDTIDLWLECFSMSSSNSQKNYWKDSQSEETQSP